MSHSITLHSGTARDAGLRRLAATAKLALRALTLGPASAAWLRVLNSHPIFVDLVKAQPRLVYKIYRPYLSRKFSGAERVALLREHYGFILRSGLGPLSVRAARTGVNLGGVAGKSGLPYVVRITAIDQMEREGELALELRQDGQLVYSCAFSFFPLAADSACQTGMGLFVGCMQGPQGEQGLGLIRDATRELHGLRPKNLMVRLLAQIGHDHGCAELRLVGNDNRAHWRAARHGKVHADYDALWRELGAARRADGDHTLPCAALAEPDLAALPSKKRSEARKRHETLAALAAAVCAGLRAPQLEAVAASARRHTDLATPAPAAARRNEA